MIHEFESIAKKIQADFERSSNLPHQGVKGDAREFAIVKGLLKPYVPPKYSIGSGLIADVTGTISKQQDIVIYDGFSLPVLQDFDQNKVFFAEQVLSVIEAKSTLTHSEIKDIIGKADSIRTLKRASKAKESRIFVFGFGYNSRMSIDQIRDYAQKKILQTGVGWGLSAIAVLSDKNGKTGLVSNVDRHAIGAIKVEATQDDPVASIETGSVGETLFVFYLLLMEAIRLTEARIVPPNYLAYSSTAGFGTINLSIGEPGIQGSPYQKAIEILRTAQEYSDYAVINAWHLLTKMGEDYGHGEILGRGTFFTLGKKRITEGPTPQEVWESVNRYMRDSTTTEDNTHLRFLVGILREVAKENTHLGMASEGSR